MKVFVLDVDDIVELAEVVKQIVVTLLEIKSEVAKLIFFELVTQVIHFFNMLVKHFIQVFLNREGLHL